MAGGGSLASGSSSKTLSKKGETALATKTDRDVTGDARTDAQGRGMNSHVSAILLGVKDMDKSKRFYTEGLGWKIQHDYGVSVFFVPHGGLLVRLFRPGRPTVHTC